MGGSRSFRVSVVLTVSVAGLVFWTFWPGDRRSPRQPSNGAVSESDLELESESEQRNESPDDPETTLIDAVPPGGALRGLVYLDDSTTPALGASVVAFSGTRDYAGKALTDESGRYSVWGLEAGKYWVRAWRGTWTHRSLGSERKEYQVLAGETTEVEDITLIPGISIHGRVVEEGSEESLEGIHVRHGQLQTLTDADGTFVLEGLKAGLIRLVASGEFHASKFIPVQASVGDNLFVQIELSPGGVIHGVVTDPEGKPAERVSVSVYAGGVTQRENTDSQGLYRLQGIPLDAHGMTVTASRDGRFETKGIVPGFSQGTREFRLDLRLKQGFSLIGRVTDESGAPVAGTKLYIDWSTWEILAETAPDGTFRIDGATDRMQVLTARKEGYGPGSLSLKELEADARERITLVLPEGERISGRVIDEQGEPVAEALVYISTETHHAGPYPSAVSDGEGRFFFGGLPFDLKEIGAVRDGYVASRGNPVTAGDENLEIVLEEAGVIEGIVADAVTGAPVFPTTIKITYSDDPHFRSARRGGLSSLLVQRGVRFICKVGSFRLTEGLTPDGHYKLIVTADDYASEVLSHVAAWPASEIREPVRVLLERGESIAGSVVSASSGQPLEGVKIHHMAADRRGTHDLYWQELFRGDGRAVRQALTDEDGRFELTGIRSEAGVLLLEKVGYARTAIEGVLPSTIARFIELAPEAVLEGSVTDADGEGLPGVYISVHIDGQMLPGGKTDQEGAYRITALPAGVAHVILRGRDTPEWKEWKETTNLLVGEVTTLNVVFSSGSILGQATMAGEPVPDARVRVVCLDDMQRREVRADVDGTFRIRALKPGTYKLTARPPDRRGSYEGAVATVEVTSEETVCEIEFPAGRIGGQVVESGRPLSGVHVVLSREGERAALGGIRPARGGGWVPYDRKELVDTHEFDFDALEPGLYSITVARGRNEPAAAWAGPFELSRDSAVIGIVVEVGGERQLSVRVVEEGSAQPIESAWASLQPLEADGVRISGQRSEKGRIDFSDVPAGRYLLNVESSEHMIHAKEVDLSKGDADLNVGLKPATWIVVDFDGTGAVKEGHQLVATVLSGGDPDWSWISADGGLSKTIGSYDPRRVKEPRIQIKTRPGEYRIRFEIAPVRNAVEETALIDEERLVIVPERGEAKLRYTIPESN